MMGDYENRDADQVALRRAIELMSDDMAKRVDELDQWLDAWWETSKSETLRKAALYGSLDLELIGQAMLSVIPNPNPNGLSMNESAMLTGIAFYLQGKVARLFSQIQQGKRPDSDTFYDMAIYSLMALRIHEEGKWI